MVIDTSALLAIVLDEPECDLFLTTIDAASYRLLSAASLLEARIVLQHRHGDVAVQMLDSFIYRAQIEVREVTVEQADLAFIAHRRFGKGVHPAGLNFGDCFSYALARSTGEPLLYKGDDFATTDIASVTP